MNVDSLNPDPAVGECRDDCQCSRDGRVATFARLYQQSLTGNATPIRGACVSCSDVDAACTPTPMRSASSLPS
eukprot:437230-Pelagomonas_calceolata.AAC.1